MQAALAAVSKYDHAVSKALLLSMDDPTSDKGADLAKHQKATELLLNKLPLQPFKTDFIEGMKIIGRQRPIKEFVTDLRGRIKDIGGDISNELEDNLQQPDKGDEGPEDLKR